MPPPNERGPGEIWAALGPDVETSRRYCIIISFQSKATPFFLKEKGGKKNFNYHLPLLRRDLTSCFTPPSRTKGPKRTSILICHCCKNILLLALPLLLAQRGQKELPFPSATAAKTFYFLLYPFSSHKGGKKNFHSHLPLLQRDLTSCLTPSSRTKGAKRTSIPICHCCEEILLLAPR